MLPPDRPITRKQDLIRAVRAMSPGLLSRKAPYSASTGNLPPMAAMRESGLAASGSTADISRMATGAPVLADALDSTTRTVHELESTVNNSAKAFNELKQRVLAKEKRLEDMKTELAALRNENNTLAAVEARTHLLGVGMDAGVAKPTSGENSLVAEVAALIDLESEDEDAGSVDGEEGEEWSLRMNSSTSDRHNRAQTVALLAKSQRLANTSATEKGAPPVSSAVGSFSPAAFPTIALTTRAVTASGAASANESASRSGVAASGGALHASSAGKSGAQGGAAGSAAGGGITLTLTPVELAEVERIRSLRRQIKAVRRSMAKRDFTRRQYEYMAARLRGNAAAFERHMKGLDDAIRAARKELNDVSGYLRMLETSKDGAVSDMHKLQEHLAGERAARAKDLDERRAELTRATQMEVWRKQRAAVRAEMRAELAGDLSREQEEQLLATLRTKEAALQQLQTERRVREERASTLQDAFVRIKAATGVSTLDEMVDRFLSAPHLRTALLKECDDSRSRWNAAREALEAAQKEYDGLKASGAGGPSGAAVAAMVRGDDSFKDELDRLEKTLAGARSVLRLHRSGVERLEAILLTVRQGAVGLAAMLEPFKDVLPPGVQLAMATGGLALGSPGSAGRSPRHSSGDDSPRSSIGSPRLLDVRRQGNDTMKYLARVDAGLGGMLDILSSAMRELVRSDGAALPSDGELFHALEPLLQLGEPQLQQAREAAPGTSSRSALTARLAELLLSRARAVRSLSAASVRMLAGGPFAPEPTLPANRPSSRGFMLAQEAPSFAALPPAPIMPAAEADVSLSSVTVAGQWTSASPVARSPAAIDSIVTHENNVRVSPKPAVDPLTGALVDARSAAFALEASSSTDRHVPRGGGASSAPLAAALPSTDDTNDADEDEDDDGLDTLLSSSLRLGVAAAPATSGAPRKVLTASTAAGAAGGNDGASARGSVVSANSARAAARERHPGAGSPAGFRTSQYAGAIHHHGREPDEHGLAALAALGVSNVPGLAQGPTTVKAEEDDEILDRTSLKRRAAEMHVLRAEEARRKPADAAPAAHLPGATAAAPAEAVNSMGSPGATHRPSAAMGSPGVHARGRDGSVTAASGHVSGLAYLTQRPKLH